MCLCGGDFGPIATAAVQHRQSQQERKVHHVQGGFSLSISQPTWSKVAVAVRIKLAVEDIQRQNKAARCARVISHSKHIAAGMCGVCRQDGLDSSL